MWFELHAWGADLPLLGVTIRDVGVSDVAGVGLFASAGEACITADKAVGKTGT